MKKLFCLFLVFALFLSAFAFSVNAQSGVSAQKLNNYLQKGEQLNLSVSFTTDEVSNTFMYELCYDTTVLEFLSVSGGMCNEYESGKLLYLNVGNSKNDNVTFTFRAKSDGTTDVVFKNITSSDGNKEYTYAEFTCAVTIDVATRGDADGDGEINTTDLAVLKLYLAGVEKEINPFADYDKNGEVDTTDLAALKLYLAGC